MKKVKVPTAKKDVIPKWDGHESWDKDKFAKHYYDSMNFYRLDYDKDLKIKVIDWMGRNNYDKDTIKAFKKTKDWRCSTTMGSIAANLLNGMPDVRQDFNNGRAHSVWLDFRIRTSITEGENDAQFEDTSETPLKTAQTLNIQDRIKEQAGTMCDELDAAVDDFISNPDQFDPDAIKVVSVLRGKGAKAAQARYIKTFYQRDLDQVFEYLENPDDQLKEGYKRYGKKNAKKIYQFYSNIMNACDQIASEAKLLKKPKKKKVKPAEELVKKLKFRAIDDKLGIVSVPPAGIIGSQMIMIYNTKNRKLGCYISLGIEGMAVKGTSLTNFAESSKQKTLRKPPEQLKEFKELTTKTKVDQWFKKIKTTETALNGRFNEDIVILRIFK